MHLYVLRVAPFTDAADALNDAYFFLSTSELTVRSSLPDRGLLLLSGGAEPAPEATALLLLELVAPPLLLLACGGDVTDAATTTFCDVTTAGLLDVALLPGLMT